MSKGPKETGNAEPGKARQQSVNDEEFDQRRRMLDDALAARKRQEQSDGKQATKGGAAGYAAALKLSSEFIAGILVGTGIGWIIDRLAGTSPWGLIIFFLLGFCAAGDKIGGPETEAAGRQTVDAGRRACRHGDDDEVGNWLLIPPGLIRFISFRSIR